MALSYTEIFQSFQQCINLEHALREEMKDTVKELEHIYREILIVLQVIHYPEGMTDVLLLCQKVREMFSRVRKGYAILANLVQNQYYKFNDRWRYVTQRFIYVAGLVVFLESGRLLKFEEAAEFLGTKVLASEGFHIEVGVFLMGLLLLADEMPRLAVNCVTRGDYGRPVQIAQFLTELSAGFRLLNFRNDMLIKKKYDSLKYDLKRCEEVVYDLSIRGLKPQLVEEDLPGKKTGNTPD